MKKLILIIAIVFSGMLMQAQSLREISSEYLGAFVIQKPGKKNNDLPSIRTQTDYGTITFKRRVKNYLVWRVVCSITNDNPIYDSILDNKDYSEYKVGNVWTDFIFYYEEFKSKSFDNVISAKEYLEKEKNPNMNIHNNARIYKHPKKEKYLVALTKKGNFGLYTTDTNKPITSKWLVLE